MDDNLNHLLSITTMVTTGLILVDLEYYKRELNAQDDPDGKLRSEKGKVAYLIDVVQAVLDDKTGKN